ncbi:phage portal protein [Dactylosporangium siamense]|uniref:Phage portal protein n=1 Tax=Dactylosporangium siamense TaxID=685454 RepID=A0A919PDV6_9ACTN|nr:phage portal protein [Dactylosporangium siamense]GIG42990.1 hypothetical protein Dsi01nite_010310 [Dactylosporangium siamense]
MPGFWSTLLTGRVQAVSPDTAPALQPARHRFALGDNDFPTWQALVGGTAMTGKVSRREAFAVPAVKRARDLVAGTIGTLPLHAINAAGEQVAHALLEQPESLQGLVRSVSVTRLVEDLIYDGRSLWLVVLRTSTGFPQVVERIEYGKWSQDETGTIRVDGREMSPEQIILFTSPCDPLLLAGAPAIRNLIRLEATAALYADSPEPASYFTPVDGVDPEDPAEVERLLTDWRNARKVRATAYVPGGLQLNTVDRMSPESMQLVAAREFSVTEIARLTGIDADWLSVNTTSRTYANAQDARRSFVDFVLAPYLHAVEERLSLGDVTPRGQRVRFNLDGFLRADTLTRYQAHQIALNAGFLTVDEVRALEDRPPLEAEA